MTSLAHNTNARHGVTYVTKDTLPNANEGETAVSTGVNGVGKLMMSKIALGSSCLKIGLTKPTGEDTIYMFVDKSAGKGSV